MKVIIKKSINPDKKYDAIFDDNKTLSFGANGYSDYTIHKDDIRKEHYIDRHRKNEDYNKSGIKSAGFLSRWILWNKPTIQESIDFLNNKYKDVEFILG